MSLTKAKSRRIRRITGLETEYGCLVSGPGEGQRLTHQIRDWIFENHRYGLIDLHDRDWDEPPGNGGFLFNGGRVYLDMGHIEYCTAECANTGDVTRHDRAGDRILLEAVRALDLKDRVSFIRNNIDHRSGATFGCHENYSMTRDAPFTEKNVLSLLAFLTLRLLFAGAGRVGEAAAAGRVYVGTKAEGVDFQISQRADFVRNDFYEWVQQNRAIINTRDEPLADPGRYRRLHLLHGDTNVLPAALYLKIGSTRLVLDLLESNDLPPVALADAVSALRSLSRQLAPPWTVRLAGGGSGDALELLSRFRDHAHRRFAGRDMETDAILSLWARVEKGLAGDVNSLVGIVDWVTKRQLLEAFRESENLKWDDPWLESQDLEYHQVDPERSLGLALADMNGPWAEGLDSAETLVSPPIDTRAAARSAWMREIAKGNRRYEVDWDRVQADEGEFRLMLDPFDPA